MQSSGGRNEISNRLGSILWSSYRTKVHGGMREGSPLSPEASVTFGDCTEKLPELAVNNNPKKRFDLLFTSPPYCGVTNYHYDQWLRLWLLGAPPQPTYSDGLYQSKFASRDQYSALLRTAFLQAATLLKRKAKIYVRTDAREFTFETTKAALHEVFPKKCLVEIQQPYAKRTQTSLYGDKKENQEKLIFLHFSRCCFSCGCGQHHASFVPFVVRLRPRNCFPACAHARHRPRAIRDFAASPDSSVSFSSSTSM